MVQIQENDFLKGFRELLEKCGVTRVYAEEFTGNGESDVMYYIPNELDSMYRIEIELYVTRYGCRTESDYDPDAWRGIEDGYTPEYAPAIFIDGEWFVEEDMYANREILSDELYKEVKDFIHNLFASMSVYCVPYVIISLYECAVVLLSWEYYEQNGDDPRGKLVIPDILSIAGGWSSYRKFRNILSHSPYRYKSIRSYIGFMYRTNSIGKLLDKVGCGDINLSLFNMQLKTYKQYVETLYRRSIIKEA